MALVDTIRSVVSLANILTASLQALVVHQHWTGQDMYGTPIYTTTSPMALIEFRQERVKSFSGQEQVAKTKITFLRPTVVDEQDILTLPDGTTGPILALGGFIDAGTGVGFYTEVWLG